MPQVNNDVEYTHVLELAKERIVQYHFFFCYSRRNPSEQTDKDQPNGHCSSY